MDKSSGTSDLKKEIITVDTARKLFSFVLTARGVDVSQTIGIFETNDMFKSLSEKSKQMTQDVWAKGKTPRIQAQLNEFFETGKVSLGDCSEENKKNTYLGSIKGFEDTIEGKIQEWNSKGRTDLVQEIKRSPTYSNIKVKSKKDTPSLSKDEER